MSPDRDRYEAFYIDKLWHLIPEVYRAADTEQSPDETGPLYELVKRIGTQAAIVRRAIDRAWEDQSPETCDAWAVAYLGDLLATHLLPYLDDRARRLDVAKTIYYRRRKGTLAVLEELAADLTQWDVKVVEFFRRLGRTRHNFDPAVGGVRELLVAQGLVGRRSGTPAGGTADLRNAATARDSRSAFDEFAHTADFRRGRGTTGWYGIPKIGVFVWRLTSYAVSGVTPVKVEGSVNEYTFDPTGRDGPLFAKGRRDTDAFGNWISPEAWDLAGPVSRAVWHTVTGDDRKKLSPGSFASAGEPSPKTDDIGPECGRFRTDRPNPTASYCYGFAADIGAGPYDRRQYRPDGIAFAAPDVTFQGGGAMGGLPATGVAELMDSRTYAIAAGNVAVETLTIQAEDRMRPVVRQIGGTWVFEGQSDKSELVLDGLLLTGGVHVVLRGTFARVVIRSCTFDPGRQAESGPDPYAKAVDGSQLAATELRIDGQVEHLTVDRSVLGPLRLTALIGRVSFADFSDCIIQSLDLPEADVSLTRCTVLGTTAMRTIDASECLLFGKATVEDRQRGCVRFTGWMTKSQLPRKFESVELPAGSSVLASTDFGNPHYCVLTEAASLALREGGEGGREMGAFASADWPLKKRGLLAKFEEHLPVGLVPVVIDVT